MLGHSYLVVANRSKATLYEMQDDASALKPIKKITNVLGRSKDQWLVTDRPGSMSGGGNRIPGSDAMAPGQSPTERVLEEFAGEVAEMLDNTRKKEKTYNINIIAEPKFLGALRKKLDSPTQKLVKHTVSKDVVDADKDKLLSYLKQANKPDLPY